MGGLFSRSLPPIHQACVDGNVQVVQALIAAAGDDASTLVNAPSGVFSITPLFLAQDGRMDIARALLKAGAQVDISVQHNISPLHIASAQGHLSVVQALLAAGANVNSRDKFGNAPLVHACISGHLAVVETSLDAGASSGERQPRAKEMALLAAITSRRLDVVKLLLANGANPNALIASAKCTPLHVTVASGDARIVQALLHAGADLQTAGRTSKEDRKTLMYQASFGGFTDIVRLLIRAGATVNAVDSNVNSPLLFACAGKHVETVRELVEAGADVTHLGSEGYSSLHAAASDGCDNVLRVLLARADSSAERKQVDASVVDKFGVVEILSAAGGAKTESKRSPLHTASKRGNALAVALFLHAGVDANVATPSGMTPLHAASMQHEKMIPHLLLLGGANVHATTTTGRTPLQIATKLGHEGVAGTLATAETTVQQKR